MPKGDLLKGGCLVSPSLAGDLDKFIRKTGIRIGVSTLFVQTYSLPLQSIVYHNISTNYKDTPCFSYHYVKWIQYLCTRVINTNPSDQNKWINLIFMICLHYPRLRSLSIFTDWPSSVFLDPGLLGPEVTITHAPRAAPVVIRTAASVKQSGADITFDDWSKEIFITELQIQVKSSTAFWYHIRRQDQVTNTLYRKQIFRMLLPNSYFSALRVSNPIIMSHVRKESDPGAHVRIFWAAQKVVNCDCGLLLVWRLWRVDPTITMALSPGWCPKYNKAFCQSNEKS